MTENINSSFLTHKKHIIGFCIFAITFIIVSTVFSIKCTDCKARKVNQDFFELKQEVQTGDIILTDSQDFFSRMIKDVETCPFAGAKIVYKYPDSHIGNASDVLLLISDANNLSDNKHGLRFEYLDEYFKDYKQVKIGLFRPNKKLKKVLENIEELKMQALDKTQHIPYDFSFNNDDMETLTCSKLLMRTYGNFLLDRTQEKSRKIVSTTLPCDIKLDNMTQVGQWIEYWEDDITK